MTSFILRSGPISLASLVDLRCRRIDSFASYLGMLDGGCQTIR